MARIQGVQKNQAGLMVKLVYRLGPRMMRKLAGREASIGNGLEPMEIWAHKPKLMMAMGKFNGAIRKPGTLETRVRNLCELKGSAMIGCEFCVDLGSQICRHSGLTDDELLAIPRYESSELFTEREKVALAYTVAVMRTPVEVTDDLFADLQKHFTTDQIVELTALLTLVNLDRFNAAFGIGSAGFSEGMVCIPPEKSAAGQLTKIA
jgi:alkylhydroperoxidase family enzyme